MSSAVRLLSFFLSFILVSSISGCGQGQENNAVNADTGSAVFSISWPDDAFNQGAAKALGAPTINCTGISVIRVEVYEDPASLYLAGDSFDCSLGGGTVSEIPAGSNRRVVVSALSDNDTLIFKGEKANITISRNDVTDVGLISLSKLDNELPVASIDQPQEGLFEYGDAITFIGSGKDLEDGALSDKQLQWESSIDGAIGEGTPLVFSDLSLGEHTITLSVTDNNGGVGITEIQIIVSRLLTNSIGMHFRYIPAGRFTMGSPEGEPGHLSDETQYTAIMTRPFYMQTTEVTQGQWKDVIGEGTNPSEFADCGDNCPVELVSWFDCAIFCNRLSREEGLTPSYYADSTYTTEFTGTPPVDSGTVYLNKDTNGYRLPTEAQWEYAARAGSTTAFANGNITFYEIMTVCKEDLNLLAMGWYCYNNGEEGTSEYGSKPVAEKNSNAWGIFDMHGNVWEWCQDWYLAYPTGTVLDPEGPSSGSVRVFRGGSWRHDAWGCRSAGRGRNDPDSRFIILGFRIALPYDQ